MSDVLRRLLSAAVLVVVAASPALAQGTSSSISGSSSTRRAAPFPGATVVVTSNATGTKFEAVTNSAGRVHRAGALGRRVHRHGLARGVQDRDRHRRPRSAWAFPTNVNATLEVGALAETVTVSGASAELINTQTAT